MVLDLDGLKRQDVALLALAITGGLPGKGHIRLRGGERVWRGHGGVDADFLFGRIRRVGGAGLVR